MSEPDTQQLDATGELGDESESHTVRVRDTTAPWTETTPARSWAELVETLQGGLAVLDEEWRLVYVSDRFVPILGSPAEIVGMDLRQLLPALAADDPRALGEQVQQGVQVEFVQQFRDSNDDRRWFRVTVTPTTTLAGHVGAVVFAKDTTSTSSALARLREATLSLTQIEDELNHRVARNVHDGPIQLLAALVLRLDILDDPQHTRRLRDLATTIIEQLRAAVAEFSDDGERPSPGQLLQTWITPFLETSQTTVEIEDHREQLTAQATTQAIFVFLYEAVRASISIGRRRRICVSLSDENDGDRMVLTMDNSPGHLIYTGGRVAAQFRTISSYAKSLGGSVSTTFDDGVRTLSLWLPRISPPEIIVDLAAQTSTTSAGATPQPGHEIDLSSLPPLSDEAWGEILDRAPERFLEIDNADRFSFVNNAQLSTWGLSPSDVVGQPIRAFFTADALADLEPAFDELLLGRFAEPEWRREDALGETRLIRLRTSPRIDEGGRWLGAACTTEDLTEIGFLEKLIESALSDLASTRRLATQNSVSLLEDPLRSTAMLIDLLREFDGGTPNATIFQHIRRQLEAALPKTRQSLDVINPPDLSEDDLGSALRLSLAAVLSPARLDFLDESNTDASPEDFAVLFHIAREAVINAVTHGQADLVSITLRNARDGLCLDIHDDGIGIGPNDLDPRPGHLGTRAMRDRARERGGNCRIEPSERGGTLVSVWLPGHGVSAGTQPVRDTTVPWTETTPARSWAELVETLQGGLAVLDDEWRLAYVSDRFLPALGSAHDLAGQDLRQLLPDLVNDDPREIGERIAQGIRVEFEQQFLGPNHDRRWFRITVVPSSSLGAGLRAVVFTKDTTATGSALANLREATLSLTEIEDALHRRIGREVHDGPIQLLAALVLRLDMLDDRTHAVPLREAASEAIEQLRDAVSEFSNALDSPAAAQLLRMWIAPFVDGSPIDVEIEDHRAPRVDEAATQAAFLFIYELTRAALYVGRERLLRVSLTDENGGDRIVLAIDRSSGEAIVNVGRMAAQFRAVGQYIRGLGGTVDTWMAESDLRILTAWLPRISEPTAVDPATRVRSDDGVALATEPAPIDASSLPALSDETWEEIAWAAPERLFEFDAATRFTFANEAQQDMFDLSSKDLIGVSAEDFFSPETLARLEPEFERLDLGEVIEVVWERENAFNEVRSVRSKLSPRIGANGDWLGALGTVDDFSDVDLLEKLVDSALADLALSRRLAIEKSLDRLTEPVVANEALVERLVQFERTTADPAPFCAIRKGLEDALPRIRRSVSVLENPDLSSTNLETALKISLEAMLADVTLRFIDETEQSPSAESADTLFRIAREAVVNGVIHGGADLVTVTLSDDQGSLHLEIHDNGRGIEANELVHSAGRLGARSMFERARERGGHCRIEPAAAGGTLVTVWLPPHADRPSLLSFPSVEG